MLLYKVHTRGELPQLLMNYKQAKFSFLKCFLHSFYTQQGQKCIAKLAKQILVQNFVQIDNTHA